MFVTAEGRPGPRFRRVIDRGNLTAAEQAAFELAFVSLADARALLELYAEKGDRKYERAALRYLRRYMDEAGPTLADVAQVAAVLAQAAPNDAWALAAERQRGRDAPPLIEDW